MSFVGKISGVNFESVLSTSGASNLYATSEVLWEPTEIVWDYTPPASPTVVDFGSPVFMSSGNGVIDWGDGTRQAISGTPLSHTYADDPALPHTYSVKVWGRTTFGAPPVGYTPDEVSSVVTWGKLTSVVFTDCERLASIPATTPRALSEPFWKANMFYGAKVFNDPNVVNYSSLGQPTSMYSAIRNASAFNQDISGVDVSQCTDFEWFMVGANSFDQNLSSWDTSSAQNFQFAFTGTAFNNGGDPGIANWNVSNVSNFYGCFGIANSFNQPLTNWDTTGTTTLGGMFINGSAFNNPSLNNWNVSHITSLSGMFSGSWFFNQDISGWDVSNVTDMYGLFNASPFDQNLGAWDLSSVTNMINWWGPGMSAASLVGCMIGWNNNPNTNTGVTFSGTPISISQSAYPAGKAAYDNLVFATGGGGKGWTITNITWTA